MKKTRTHLAVIAMVASMSLLAACSESENTDAPAEAPASEPSPAPAPAPAPAPEPTPSPAPTPDATPAPDAAPSTAPSGDAAPATQSPTSFGTEFKRDAKQVAAVVSDKAGDLKDATAEKISEMGSAIKSGAAEADKAIQDSAGHTAHADSTAKP